MQALGSATSISFQSGKSIIVASAVQSMPGREIKPVSFWGTVTCVLHCTCTKYRDAATEGWRTGREVRSRAVEDAAHRGEHEGLAGVVQMQPVAQQALPLRLRHHGGVQVHHGQLLRRR
jgi:hypothetical protein